MKYNRCKIMMAKELPIYDRAIAHYPHLATIKPARAFCFNLGLLAGVPTISIYEYEGIARVANGGEFDRNWDGTPAKLR